MIAATTRIVWGERHAHGSPGWRYRPQGIVVSCDEPGCSATIVPSGVEHNGPAIEAIYGCTEWKLGERDLCPEHKPAKKVAARPVIRHYYKEGDEAVPDECECGAAREDHFDQQ